MAFVQFMSSTAGRGVRLAVGALLLVVGVVLGGAWYVLAVIGLVPLLAAAFDVCLFAPLFKQPFHGRDYRR